MHSPSDFLVVHLVCFNVACGTSLEIIFASLAAFCASLSALIAAFSASLTALAAFLSALFLANSSLFLFLSSSLNLFFSKFSWSHFSLFSDSSHFLSFSFNIFKHFSLVRTWAFPVFLGLSDKTGKVRKLDNGEFFLPGCC